MIERSACPDCNRIHAIVAPTSGRSVARCTHCRRYWPPPAAFHDPGTEARHCHEHRGRKTAAVCDRCELTWCGACSRRVSAHGHTTTVSPCCREGLHPVAELQTLNPYWTEWPAVLLYAVRGGSPFVLFFLFLGGFIPIFAMTIPLFAAAYGVHVLRTSSSNPYQAPDFPDIDDVYNDLLYPLLRLLGGSLIAWLPWLLYFQFGAEPREPLIQFALLGVGLVIFPAIVLNSVLKDRLFVAISPADLLNTIRSMGFDYLALVVALALFILVLQTTSAIAGQADLLALMIRFVRFYLVITLFHLFGRSVWQTRHRIDWSI